MTCFRKNTWLLVAALGTCLLCGSVVLAGKPGNRGGGGGDQGPSYQIVKLSTDDGTGGVLSATAWDINLSRLIVGAAIVGSGDVAATYWTVTETDGAFQSELHFLDEAFFTTTSAHGCNEWGEVVGGGGDNRPLAAVYWADANSPLQELPAPLTFRDAEAINNNSVVCGWSASGFSDVDEKTALVWRFTGGEWKYLALPPLGDPSEDANGNPLPHQAIAIAISDADPDTGLIVIAGRSNGNAVLWTVALDGTGGLLAGPAAILDPDAEATGLNNTGTVCGFGRLGPSSGGDGVVWAGAGTAKLLTPTYSKFSGNPHQVFPVDVNDSGLIVGHDFFQAVVWPNEDATPILLDDFLAKGKKANFSSLSSANAVSEANEIVGDGGVSDGGPGAPFLAIPK